MASDKPADAAPATEGGEAQKAERKFKLVARKGYENEEKEADKEDGAAAGGASGEQVEGVETTQAVAAPGGATPAFGGHI